MNHSEKPPAFPPELPTSQPKSSGSKWNPTIKGKYIVFALCLGAVVWIGMATYNSVSAARKAAEQAFNSEIIVTADQPGRDDAVQWALLEAQAQYSSFLPLKTNVEYAPMEKTYNLKSQTEGLDRQAFGAAYDAWNRAANVRTVTNSNYHCEMTITHSVAKPHPGTMFRMETFTPMESSAMMYLKGRIEKVIPSYEVVRNGSYKVQQDIDGPVVTTPAGATANTVVWNNDRKTLKKDVWVYWAEVRPR